MKDEPAKKLAYVHSIFNTANFIKANGNILRVNKFVICLFTCLLFFPIHIEDLLSTIYLR
jgi:hypothetical protein